MARKVSDLHWLSKKWKSPHSSIGNVRKGSNALIEWQLPGWGKPFPLVTVREYVGVEHGEIESREVESVSLTLLFFPSDLLRRA
jgi:hypothetical protein